MHISLISAQVLCNTAQTCRLVANIWHTMRILRPWPPTVLEFFITGNGKAPSYLRKRFRGASDNSGFVLHG